MDMAEYERRLLNHLCWACGGPTHKSHAAQRQCRVCRRKWSYARRVIEWRLLMGFCRGRKAYRAAMEAEVSYPAARTAFRRFEKVLEKQRKRAVLTMVRGYRRNASAADTP